MEIKHLSLTKNYQYDVTHLPKIFNISEHFNKFRQKNSFKGTPSYHKEKI